jgi:tRNA threonylcarbamoyladenosine biosynthesis protein TsaB
LNYLIIETATCQSFVSLSKKGSLHTLHLDSRGQADSLTKAIDKLLLDHSLTPADLSFISVGIGPGSFTGSRVGVLAAKTLSFALNIPITTFCSLSTFFPKKAETNMPVLLIGDAKSKGFSVLEADPSNLETLKTPFTLMDKQTLLSKASSHKLCFDPGIDLEKKGIARHQLAHLSIEEPNISFLAVLSENAFKKGEAVEEDHVDVLYAFSP